MHVSAIAAIVVVIVLVGSGIAAAEVLDRRHARTTGNDPQTLKVDRSGSPSAR